MKMKNNWLSVLMLLSVSTQLFALEREINLRAGLEHTSNALKREMNEQSELEQHVAAGIKLAHVGSSVEVDIDYDATHIAYDKETEDDETSVVGNATLVYEQIKQQLFWTLENSRSNILSDKAAVDVQSNREDRSITTASSRLILRPEKVNSVLTELSYTNVEYEDSAEQDSNHIGADVSWLHKLSKVDTASVNLSYRDVSFDLGKGEYEYYLATVAYAAELARINYSIYAGYNESKRDEGVFRGNYFRAEANYKGGASDWSLGLLQELTDTSRGNNNTSTSQGDFDGSGTEIDLYERTNLTLGYVGNGLCAACTFNIDLNYEAQDYETLHDDNNELGVKATLAYELTRLISIKGLVGYRELAFTGQNIRDNYDITYYGMRLQQGVTKAFSVNYALIYEERDVHAASGGYDELRGGITLRYLFD